MFGQNYAVSYSMTTKLFIEKCHTDFKRNLLIISQIGPITLKVFIYKMIYLPEGILHNYRYIDAKKWQITLICICHFFLNSQ